MEKATLLLAILFGCFEYIICAARTPVASWTFTSRNGGKDLSSNGDNPVTMTNMNYGRGPNNEQNGSVILPQSFAQSMVVMNPKEKLRFYRTMTYFTRVYLTGTKGAFFEYNTGLGASKGEVGSHLWMWYGDKSVKVENTGFNNVEATGILKHNKWIDITVVWDFESLSFYVDGKLVKTVMGESYLSQTRNGHLHFGYRPGNSDYFLSGRMACSQFFDVALGAAEVINLTCDGVQEAGPPPIKITSRRRGKFPNVYMLQWNRPEMGVLQGMNYRVSYRMVTITDDLKVVYPLEKWIIHMRTGNPSKQTKRMMLIDLKAGHAYQVEIIAMTDHKRSLPNPEFVFVTATQIPLTVPHVSTTPPTRFTNRPSKFTTRPPWFTARPPRISPTPPRFTSRPPRFTSRPPRFTSRPPRFSPSPPRLTSGPPRFTSRPPRITSRPPRFSPTPPRLTSGPPRFTSRPPRITTTTATQTMSGSIKIISPRQGLSPDEYMLEWERPDMGDLPVTKYQISIRMVTIIESMDWMVPIEEWITRVQNDEPSTPTQKIYLVDLNADQTYQVEIIAMNDQRRTLPNPEFVFVTATRKQRVERKGNEIIPCNSTGYPSRTTFLLDDVVFTEGAVFAFSAFFIKQSKVVFQIWRPIFGNSYKLISYFEVENTKSRGREDIYIENLQGKSCVRVRNGDKLGIYFPESPGGLCYNFDFTNRLLASYNVANESMYDMGSIIQFDGISFPFRFSVAAYIEPYETWSPSSPDFPECPHLVIPGDEPVWTEPPVTGTTETERTTASTVSTTMTTTVTAQSRRPVASWTFNSINGGRDLSSNDKNHVTMTNMRYGRGPNDEQYGAVILPRSTDQSMVVMNPTSELRFYRTMTYFTKVFLTGNKGALFEYNTGLGTSEGTIGSSLWMWYGDRSLKVANTGFNNYEATNVLTHDRWIDIAVVWDFRVLSFYVDGKLLTAVLDKSNLSPTRNGYLHFGYRPGEDVEYFLSGKMACSQFFDVALTTTEVRHLTCD